MKKIKLNKKIVKQFSNIINEDNNTNLEIQTNNLETQEILKSTKQYISKTLMNEVINENSLVSINFTKNFYNCIKFPDPPIELENLIVHIDMPGKFKNTKDFIPDPGLTIQSSTDIATKCFKTFDLKNRIFNADPAKEINTVTLSKINNAKKNTLQTYLNEDITSNIANATTLMSNSVASSAASFGNAAAEVVKDTGIAAAGMAASVGAVSVGTYALGTQLVSSTDRGKDIADSAILAQDKDPGVENGRLLNNIEINNIQDNLSIDDNADIISRIDEYVNTTLTAYGNLVKSVAGNQINTDIFVDEVTKYLKNASNDIKIFIELHDEDLYKMQRYKEQFKSNALQATISDLLNKIDKNKNLTLEEKNRFKKLSLQRSRNSMFDDDYDYYLLNESANNISKIEFDADKIFDNLNSIFTGLALKMLSKTLPEEWTLIKNARKNMEDMINKASESIKRQIEYVCKTNSSSTSSNLSLSGQVVGFLSKHPMRAERLTLIWENHRLDLILRVEERIGHIISPSGTSPYTMMNTFITVTYPKILALMITYKSIFILLRNKRVHNLHIGEFDESEFEETVNNILSIYNDIFISCFYNNHKILTYNNTSIIQLQLDLNTGKITYTFTSVSMPYLGLLCFNLYNKNNENVKDFSKVMLGIIKLHSLTNNYEDFILNLITFAPNLRNNENILYDVFNNLPKDIQLLNNILNEFDAMKQNSSEFNEYKNILGYILTTHGAVINIIIQNRTNDLNNNLQLYINENKNNQSNNNYKDIINPFENIEIDPGYIVSLNKLENDNIFKPAFDRLLNNKSAYNGTETDIILDLFNFYNMLQLNTLNKIGENDYNNSDLYGFSHLMSVLKILNNPNTIKLSNNMALNQDENILINSIVDLLQNIY